MVSYEGRWQYNKREHMLPFVFIGIYGKLIILLTF